MHASGTHIPSSPNVAAECESPKPHALARPFFRVACQLTDSLSLRVEQLSLGLGVDIRSSK